MRRPWRLAGRGERGQFRPEPSHVRCVGCSLSPTGPRAADRRLCPLETSPPHPGRTAISTPATTPNETKLRVLLVENNADLRQLLALTIDAEPDLRCIGSTDRASGIVELARERRPDVVVMDLLLDEGPSLPMARQLRDSVPGTSILVYSGHANPALAQEAQRWGVSEYVTKGGDVEDLLAAIRRCDRAPPAS